MLVQGEHTMVASRLIVVSIVMLCGRCLFLRSRLLGGVFALFNPFQTLFVALFGVFVVRYELTELNPPQATPLQ
jgi:hypothetical protein